MKTMIDYQTLAGRTDEITTEASQGGYYFSGGGEESAEILEKMGLLTKDSAKEDSKGLALELGDRMWYAVRNIFSFRDIVPLMGMYSIDGLDENESKKTPIAFNYETLAKLVDAIVILSGKINGMRKRMLRDNGGKWTMDTIGKVCELEIQVIYLIVAASHAAGYTFREVLEMNLEKLASRQLRGTISGVGDYR